MASYIQGVTDYIPQLQPFQPDYNFLGNVLQTKQSRYDTSHKQLNKLYGTLLYSPMLRDDNTQQRDQFFQTIDQDIKKMAGLDLSLQETNEHVARHFAAAAVPTCQQKVIIITGETISELEYSAMLVFGGKGLAFIPFV